MGQWCEHGVLSRGVDRRPRCAQRGAHTLQSLRWKGVAAPDGDAGHGRVGLRLAESHREEEGASALLPMILGLLVTEEKSARLGGAGILTEMKAVEGRHQRLWALPEVTQQCRFRTGRGPLTEQDCSS